MNNNYNNNNNNQFNVFHDKISEQATLGAILLDSSCFSTVSSMLKNEDFYDMAHRIIFEAIKELADRNEPIDLITVKTQLDRMGKTDEVGVGVLAGLPNTVPTSANVRFYANNVLECSSRRKTFETSNLLNNEIRNPTADLNETLGKLKTDIENRRVSSFIYSMADLMPEIIQDQINKIEAKEKIGIPIVFSELQNMLNGFQSGELIILGARPSMGKTAIALNMMIHIVKENISCGFISLEMDHLKIATRLLAQECKVSVSKFANSTMTFDDMKRVYDTAGILSPLPFFMTDKTDMTIDELSAITGKLVKEKGIRILFIDYIGLIKPENQKAPIFEQISIISKGLKNIARKYNIPVVALCQVSRDAEGNVPTLAQLRGSGSIEQDADVVLFIHRDRIGIQNTNQNTFSPINNEHISQNAKLVLAKNRNGPIGEVELCYFPSFTKFEDKVKNQQQIAV